MAAVGTRSLSRSRGNRGGQCRPRLWAEVVESPRPWGNRPEREGAPRASPERGVSGPPAGMREPACAGSPSAVSATRCNL